MVVGGQIFSGNQSSVNSKSNEITFISECVFSVHTTSEFDNQSCIINLSYINMFLNQCKFTFLTICQFRGPELSFVIKYFRGVREELLLLHIF